MIVLKCALNLCHREINAVYWSSWSFRSIRCLLYIVTSVRLRTQTSKVSSIFQAEENVTRKSEIVHDKCSNIARKSNEEVIVVNITFLSF